MMLRFSAGPIAALFIFVALGCNSSGGSAQSGSGGAMGSGGKTGAGGASTSAGGSSGGAAGSGGKLTATGGTSGSGDASVGSGGKTTQGSGGASVGSGGTTSSGGTLGTGGSSLPPGVCDPGSSSTTWASNCPTAPATTCTTGTWTAGGPQNDSCCSAMTLRSESAHFAVYGDEASTTAALAQSAVDHLETVWSLYFGSPMYEREPFCSTDGHVDRHRWLVRSLGSRSRVHARRAVGRGWLGL